MHDPNRPDLTPERWSRISAILDVVLELPAEQRAAHIDRVCAGDDALRAAVEDLLAAEREAGSFLQEGVSGAQTLFRQIAQEGDDAPDPLIGEVLGSWRLVRRLGQGGMGVVYLAERVGGDFRQTAALKLIKRGLDTDEILQRFRRERQILARLQHPFIARLLDGGAAPDGRPFIVMEHVEGEAITHYCDRLKLPVEERLRLFLDACDAVEYAHRHLVVHRDIKPSNILITKEGQVRLLDFGIARVMEDPEGESGLALTRGALQIMTIDYASPELVRGEPASTATDVYALGLVLFELLVGRRAYATAGRTSQEIAQTILETPPDPPSKALHRGTSGDRAAMAGPDADELAGSRGTTAEKLRRRLRGDLEIIVLTALRKEPERRYAGPGLLAEDLRRHLKGLPVRARKDVWSYRAGRFISRHRVAMAAAAIVFLSLVGGLAGVAWQSHLRSLEARRTEAVKDFLISVFEGAAPSQALGEKVTARELLDKGSARIDAELSGQPLIQAELLGVVGNLYREIGLPARGESLLERSVKMKRSIYGAAHPEVAEAMERWGVALWDKGDYQQAARVEEEALALRRRILRPGDPKISESLTSLADVYSDLGKTEQALALHQESLRIDEAAFGRESAAAATDLMNCGKSLTDLTRYDEAAPLLRESLAIRRRLLPADHPDVATAMHTLAAMLSVKGDYPEAEALYRQALDIRRKVLGSDHPDVALTLNGLESVLEKRGDYAGAVPFAREGLEIRRRALGPEHPDLASSLNNYATLCYRTGEYDEAERGFRQALEIWRKELGSDHPNVATALNNIGMVLREEGRLAEAERSLRQGLELRLKLKGGASQEAAQSLRCLGLVETDQGRLGTADADLSRSLDISRKVYPAGHPRVAEVLLALGRLRNLEGRAGEAEPLAREALAIDVEKTGADSPPTADAKIVLGDALTLRGRGSEAAAPIREALEIRRARFGEKSWQAAEASYHLALCLSSQGKRTEARALLQTSVATLEAKRGGGDRLQTLDEQAGSVADPTAEVVEVDQALAKLEALDPRMGKIVELRFFGGLSVEETAEILEISARTVKREWTKARAFLYHQLRRQST